MIYTRLVARAFYIVLAITAASQASAYEITSPSETTYTESSFKSTNGAPEIEFYTLKSCEKDCDKFLAIGNKEMRFSPSATVIAEARYRGKSFAVVKQDYLRRNGKTSSSRNEYYFASQSGAYKRVSKPLCRSALDTGITSDGQLVCVTDKAIEVHNAKDSREFELPVNADIASVNNNLAGTLGISIIDSQSKQLAYSNYYNLNTKGSDIWKTMPTFIHGRSDHRNVMGIYPIDRTSGVVAVYEYVSALNKGLNLYRFDAKGENYRIITNNEETNWGGGET